MLIKCPICNIYQDSYIFTDFKTHSCKNKLYLIVISSTGYIIKVFKPKATFTASSSFGHEFPKTEIYRHEWSSTLLFSEMRFIYPNELLNLTNRFIKLNLYS